MASKLEFNLRDTLTVHEKIQLFSFDWSNYFGPIYMKMNESIFEKKLSFQILGLSFSSKLD